MEYVVCSFSELKERELYTVDIDGLEVGVILSRGKLFAYENNCPHNGGPVCLGDVHPAVKLKLNDQKMAVAEYGDENDLRLVCPWHTYEFELETGRCTVDSHLNMHKYETFVRDGQVIVRVS